MLILENIFPLSIILKELQKTDDFISWIKDRDESLNKNKLFDGYNFFVRLVLGGILDIINDEDFLHLEEDEIYLRSKALFDSYKDYPNSCDKVIVLKNLISIVKDIELIKDFKNLKKNLTKFNNLVDVLKILLEKQVTSKISSYDKPTIIRYDVLSLINFLFNDTNDSHPEIINRSFLLKPYLDQEQSKKVLKGYVYTLQYVWSIFLSESYDSAPITRLYESLEIDYYKPEECFDYKKETSPVWWNINKFHSEMNKFLYSLMKDSFSAKYWELKTLIKFSNTNENKEFVVNKLKKFLGKKNIENVDYLINNDTDSKARRLDMQMLFYPAETISFLYTSIFDQTDAFVVILNGLFASLEPSEDKRLIKIKIFKHPAFVKDKKICNMISLAILLPHTWKDRDNGWLIFSHCATDFSGYGSKLYERARNLIDNNKLLIDFEEIEVTNLVFAHYLEYKSATIGSYSTIHQLIKKEELDSYIESTEKQINKFIGAIDETKAKLFEKIVYEWYTKESDDEYLKIESNYKFSKEEIDLVLFLKDEIQIIECKIDIHKYSLQKPVIQLDKRYREAKRHSPKSSVKKVLIVYNEISEERRTFYLDNGIIVKDNFREIIKKSKLGEKRKLFTILGSKNLIKNK